jgi:hypothetical protein
MGVVIEYKLFSTSFPHTQPLNATQKTETAYVRYYTMLCHGTLTLYTLCLIH